MKFTQEDFEFFKKECAYWIERYGLKQWNVIFFHKQLNERDAETYTDIENFFAQISLTKSFKENQDEDKIKNLKQAAKHEIFHILFAKLKSKAKWRYATDYQIDEAEHEIIRILEKDHDNNPKGRKL